MRMELHVLKQQKKEKEEQNKEEEEEKQRKIQARQLKYTARYKRRLEQFKRQEQQALDQEENHMAKDKGITKVQNTASPNIFVNALPFIGSRVILLCVSQTSIIGILTAVDEQKGTISLEDVQLADEDGSIRLIELPPDFLKSNKFSRPYRSTDSIEMRPKDSTNIQLIDAATESRRIRNNSKLNFYLSQPKRSFRDQTLPRIFNYADKLTPIAWLRFLAFLIVTRLFQRHYNSTLSKKDFNRTDLKQVLLLFHFIASLGFDEQILTNLLAGTPFFLRVLLPGAPVTPLNVPCFPWFFSMKKSTLAGSVAYFIYIMFTLSVLWSTEILSSMMYRPDKNTYFNFYFNDWCKRDIFATGYLCDTHHHTINTFFKSFLYGSNCYDICIGMSIMWFLIASMFDVGIFYSSRPGK